MSKINYNLSKLTLYDKKKILDPPDVSDIIVLDINNEDKSDKYSYFSRNDYKEYALCTGNYVNKIQQGDFVIWESCNKNDCSHLVLFYDGDDKYIVIVPYEGNLILLHKSSDGSWINIKTKVDLNKLQMFQKNGNDLCIGMFYYDLQLFNLKIVFEIRCEMIVYQRRLIYNHCNKPIHGHPYSLTFNLKDGTISIHLTDESILTFQNLKTELPEITNFRISDKNDDCYKPSHFNVNHGVEVYKDEQLHKQLCLYGFKKHICSAYKNYYDKSVDTEAESVIVDGNLIMSTDKYVTYCSQSVRGFEAKQGYYIGKILNRSPRYGNLDLPQYIYNKKTIRNSRYLSTENRDLEYNYKYCIDYFGSIRPDITRLKFYNMEDIEITSDGFDVTHDDFFYAIRFKTELYRVVYNGKEYWNYNNDNSNGFPNKIYFTDYNNDMNVCFNDGKIVKVKIKVHFLKLYTTDEFGNSVPINENYCRITKPEKCKQLYKLKEGAKCTEIYFYDVELIWKHKEGDPYPISICYDYEFYEASVRFEKYFIISMRGRHNTTWDTLLFPIPRSLKLFQLNGHGETVELNDKHYFLTCDHFGDFRYKMNKNVECVEIKLGDLSIWRHQPSQPYPHTVSYLIFHGFITGFCKTLNIKMERKRGIWITKFHPIQLFEKFRRNKKLKLTNSKS
ncbi:hypothetical protein TpMuguga_02g00274 [Theileria parva strain Muguga]|uniref:Uncharacterized protein n=1 Tax=Theileria parva TaxID=5875 RepID=Q4N5L6_THEPA|nr:uncharacterized protein TpMuguga_02g00274 [Theileria parva strain Muguga]EAN32557.1 hypothetical protein TpMuguga_02g00274 [Theileria parva strain Muguga]|eukprot:XP_764840.1 hypothetical protein [Theileria parva strain Muguga]